MWCVWCFPQAVHASGERLETLSFDVGCQDEQSMNLSSKWCLHTYQLMPHHRLLLKHEQLHSVLIFTFLLPHPSIHPRGGHIPSNKFFALQLASAHFKGAASVAFFSENPRELLTSKLSKTKSFEYFPINLRLTLTFFSQCSHCLNNWISPLRPSCLAFCSVKDLSNSFPKDHSRFKTERPFSAKVHFYISLLGCVI